MTNQIPIFIINLKRDIAKKERMEAMLGKLNLEFSIFEAFDGRDLSDAAIATIYDRNNPRLKRQLSLGEIGCAMSHLGVYQKIIADGIKHAIILEDDAIIGKDFIDCLPIIECMPQDWELVLLGHSDSPNGLRHFCKVTIPTANNRTKFSIGRPIITVGGTYGYIINQKGAGKMLDKIKLQMQIDGYTGNYKEVNLYAIYPHTVRVDFGANSSIGGSRTKKTKTNKLYQKISDYNRARKLKRKWSVNCFVKLLVYKITNCFK